MAELGLMVLGIAMTFCLLRLAEKVQAKQLVPIKTDRKSGRS